jgi:hypothetical protein
MWSMPPSPRWLLLRALDAPPDVAQRCTLAAHASLRRLRSHTLCAPLVCDEDACAAEISSIQRTLSEVSGNDDGKCDGRDSEGGRSSGGGRSGGGCAELLQARRALIAGLGLVLLQQVTGQPSVLYYQESIFRDAVSLTLTLTLALVPTLTLTLTLTRTTISPSYATRSV